jgi:methylenetetrahydrofolate reductase (NADPH)
MTDRVDRKKPLQVSLKVGVGDSVGFSRRQTGLIGMLSRHGGYCPDGLVERVAPFAGDEHYDILGLDLYTFDRVEGTEEAKDARPREGQGHKSGTMRRG